MSNFYSGSRIFEPVSDLLGLGVDELNFLLCQFSAILFGRVFKDRFSTAKIGATKRHIIELVAGIILTTFCFGYQIVHLLIQAVPVYLILCFVPHQTGRNVIFVFTLGYLSVCHIMRIYLDYGGYTLDITGPLMILTQKLSSLAFNIADGELLNKDKPVKNERHKEHAVRQLPSLLEYFSYVFHFHGVILGPFVHFTDYIRFIEDRFDIYLKTDQNKHTFKKKKAEILSGTSQLQWYLITAVAYGFAMLYLLPKFPAQYLITEEYKSSNLVYKMVLFYIATFLIRQKYYFAWALSSAANISAGFGFCGFDEKTEQPMYNIVANFNFKQIEMGTSMKVIVDGWNLGTISWLREVVYERVPRSVGTSAVFLCSAFWHGFYPGYYLCFVSAAFFTNVGRVCRRHLRPHILKHDLGMVYDIFTWAAGIFALNYSAVPFMLLEMVSTIRFWATLYFCIHVLAVLLYFGCPQLPRLPSPDTGASKTPSSTSVPTPADPTTPHQGRSADPTTFINNNNNIEDSDLIATDKNSSNSSRGSTEQSLNTQIHLRES